MTDEIPLKNGISPLSEISSEILYELYRKMDFQSVYFFSLTSQRAHKLLATPKMVNALIQIHIDPLIENCSKSFEKSQRQTSLKIFQILSIFSHSVMFPVTPDVATIPIMQKMFKRLEEKSFEEHCPGPLFFLINTIDKKFHRFEEEKLCFNPLLGRFLYNLPTIASISILNVTGMREISRRHDQNLLTEFDKTDLHWKKISSFAREKRDLVFIRGVSTSFLKEVLENYAETTRPNEYCITHTLPKTLQSLEDKNDFYQKLIIFLEFYKKNCENWSPTYQIYALDCILHPTIYFLEKYLHTDLLLHDNIGIWICQKLREHISGAEDCDAPSLITFQSQFNRFLITAIFYRELRHMVKSNCCPI